MNNDIERLLNDNIGLKKALQSHRLKYEKLQNDNQALKDCKEYLENENKSLKNSMSSLQNKYRNVLSENEKNATTFITQIEELKTIIERKEQQLQNIQLKLIPNFDQDMLRVKLIAEMEGPYQQAVEKKNREIEKLKNEVHSLQRKKQILEFTLERKEQDMRRQVQQIKNFHQNQNDRLMKQITHLSAKQQVKYLENDTLKSYRREINELKSTLQHYQHQEENQKVEIMALKQEKQKLINDISNLNLQRALQIQQGNNTNDASKIKKENSHLQEEIILFKDENSRLKQRIKNLQKQNHQYQHQRQQEVWQLRNLLQKDRQKYQNQIFALKEEHMKTKELKNREQANYNRVSEKYQLLEKEYDELKSQHRKLKQKIMSTEGLTDQFKRRLQEKSQQQKKYQKRQNQSPSRDNEKKESQERVILNLKTKIARLNEKLSEANQKIVQLIRQKVACKNWENENNARTSETLYLNNRDCGMMPLLPPLAFDNEGYL